MKKSLFLNMALTFPIILIICVGNVSAAILDQSFDPGPSPGTSAPLTSEVNWAQTFTVGLTGTLTQVDVLLNKSGPVITPPGNEITLEIRTTTSGIPDNGGSSVLASVQIPPDIIGYNESFIPVDVSSSGLAATTGDILAIVLRAPGIDVSGGLDIDWWGSSLNEYDSGALFVQKLFQGSLEWELIDSGITDLGFRTYMQVIPIPASVWLFGTGLLGLVGIARRKKA